MSASPPLMPPPSPSPAPRPAPRMTVARFATAVKVLTRLTVTRGRVLAFVAGSVPLVLAAISIGLEDGRVTRFVEEAVLGLALPIGALTLGSAVLGDLVDDATLVYLRLRPVPIRYQALAATLASTLAAGPPLAALAATVAVLGGQPGLAVAAAGTTLLGALAYSAVFVALGLRTDRSMLWGLLYIAVVEGFFSRLSDTMATYAIRRYVGSLYEAWGGRAALPDVATWHALLAVAVIAAAGTALTARWLLARDVP